MLAGGVYSFCLPTADLQGSSEETGSLMGKLFTNLNAKDRKAHATILYQGPLPPKHRALPDWGLTSVQHNDRGYSCISRESRILLDILQRSCGMCSINSMSVSGSGLPRKSDRTPALREGKLALPHVPYIPIVASFWGIRSRAGFLVSNVSIAKRKR